MQRDLSRCDWLVVVGWQFNGFMERSHEKAMAKHRVTIAQEESKAKIAEETATADIRHDLMMADASRHSWKDEFWIIVLALPFVLIFIPGLKPHIEAGFIALEASTPEEWYRYALLTAIGAAFGVSQLRRFLGTKK